MHTFLPDHAIERLPLDNIHNLTRAATYYAAKGYHPGMVRALLLEYDGCVLRHPFDESGHICAEPELPAFLDALWTQWADEAELGSFPGLPVCATCGSCVGAGCPDSTDDEIAAATCILFDGEPTFTVEGEYL